MSGIAGPFLAGFVAGEGHFWIRRNNGGQSWACGFQLVQREDNAELVAAARAVAGVGHIRRKPPWRSSRAQVAWTVQRIDDCFSLVCLLETLPLVGKKAGDFRIWRTAVARWAQLEDGRSRWPHLKELAGTLRAYRQPAYASHHARVDLSEEYLGGFLAGFASAEGHYGASREGHPRFVIKLRADDAGVLRLLASRFEVGRLVPLAAKTGTRAQTMWIVTRLAELRRLTAVFDRHPPGGRAGRIYAPWRQLVLCEAREAAVRRPLAAQIRATRQRLKSERAPNRLPTRTPKRSAYLTALKRWARTAGGPLTAPSYAAWRCEVAPTAPNRNTIARAFGSWRAALIAAGLPTDHAKPANAIAKGRRRTAGERLARSLSRREAVMQSVRRCSIALGRPPAATEYLRWRLDADPLSPSQATVYRLFPGGWSEVLAALEARFT